MIGGREERGGRPRLTLWSLIQLGSLLSLPRSEDAPMSLPLTQGLPFPRETGKLSQKFPASLLSRRPAGGALQSRELLGSPIAK